MAVGPVFSNSKQNIAMATNQEGKTASLEALRKRQQEEYFIGEDLDKACEELFDSKIKLDAVEKLFRKTTERKVTNLRPDIDYPDGLTFAKRLFQTGCDHLRTLQNIAPSQRNANVFKRAIFLSKIIASRIIAHTAMAYVAYWKNCEAYNNFGVLGYQSKAYAQLVCGNNWDFLVPLILLKQDEELLDETAKDAEKVFAHAKTSLAYALCLQAQILSRPLSEQPSLPVILDDPEENLPLKIEDILVKEKIVPAKLPVVDDSALALQTQKAIRAAHAAYIGNEIKEGVCIHRERQAATPKSRLN